MKNRTLHIVSLGCAKNLVDSEMMLGSLELGGYQVVADPAEADLILVNTCGFIQSAVNEAVDEILCLSEYKQQDTEKQLVVTGCMVQRYGKKLQEALPEVDLFVGLDDEPQLLQLINELPNGSGIYHRSPSRFIVNCSLPRRLSTPPFRSYLKITEGCDNRCTYCMIPSIRGDLRSRTIVDLVTEAQSLAAAGVRELTLIAQDLTAYGDDLGAKVNLVNLLRALLADTDIPWLRLLYLYPVSTDDQLLQLMAEQPRIVPYLDIPFQHASDTVLRRMVRRYSQQDLEQQISRIRSFLPDCAIRTTMLVGFPGEREDDVKLLLDCLQRWQLDHVGVFAYEDEEGSVAEKLKNKIEDGEKQNRFQQVMELQAGISKKLLAKYVGREEQVLVEGLSRETDLLLEGRSRYQAPDIDGCVLINEGTASPGDIVTVRITEAHVYDLVGGIMP
jgi:ribosomal protein S12 methylthiotransferase